MVARRGLGRSGAALLLLLLGTRGAGRAADAPATASAGPGEAADVSVKAVGLAPRLIGGANGRFAVIAESGANGVRLSELAEAAWEEWRESLGLPVRLPVSITVRLVPEPLWAFGAAWSQVTAEAGGVVSVWIREGGVAGVERERRWLTALAEGALRRKAFLLGLDPARAKVPAWLTAGAAEAVVVNGRPAMLDAWQAAMRGGDQPARLRDILQWDGSRADAANERIALAAHGAWLWLREEGARSGAWAKFTAALIAGEAPGAALAREYARLTPRPTEAREWELAWRVAAARLARARATPVMEPAETRRRLEALARMLVLDTRTGLERMLPAWGEWATREEAWPAAERRERARLVVAEFSRLHPFYRNAAGSLGRAWTALAEGKEAMWREASAEWAQDLATGRALEEASARLLDEVEAERAAKASRDAGR